MTDRDAARVLDRLIRVRRVRARLVLAALGRTQARALAEAALQARVTNLLAHGGAAPGPVAAAAAASRAMTDAMLGRLADDVARRLAATTAERRAGVEALGRARAAVDAAVARRAEREQE
ncbi:hypothetical protein [Sandarakinorhabdus sp. DWP1-3-1]|uniref:hypothetical protein n=1 Tax=Sandarakinorhabdus sp. DWP1-3-1 TaxID=2804627 RepID=UPI003CF954F1